MNRLIVAALAALLAAQFVPQTALAQEKKAKPNILIVLTDDQGIGDFSCHGNPVLKTPNLDKWQAKSVRFTDFHVAPMCTPTRGQLMTGRDAVRNGATSVTGGRAFLRTGLLTLPQFLRSLGYHTGLFGKWHLGDNYPHRPTDRGFEEAVYHQGWGMTAAPEFLGKMFDGRYFHNGAEKQFKGYMTDFWFDKAMAWMKECHAKKEPFFCYLATNAPHAPHIVPEKFSAPYKNTKAAGFFGMIANIDENIARLDAFLKENGLEENTIVIFMTDNGGTAGVSTYNYGLRGGKTTFYEGGHRVPCWIRGPGIVGQPRDVSIPAQVQDIFPTLLDLCGLEAPKDAGLDGRSLGDLLRQAKRPFPERMMVVQYSRAKLTKYESCLIWNRWRLVHGTELYDVNADKAEKNDVSAQHPDVARKMKEHYEKWWTELEPLSSKFVATTIGSKFQPLTPLTSSDWQDLYTDNAGHVSEAAGGPRGGVWHVDVDADGDYEIALRRWPRELDLTLTAARADYKKSVALPVASAKVEIQGKTFSAKSPGKDAKEIVLRVPLKRGTTTLQAWFQNAEGADLAGAFYAYVRRLPEGK